MPSFNVCSNRSSLQTSSGAAPTLRAYNSFERDDGTPLNYSLVNIKDWCKNTFEVVNQLRKNTDNSHHR
jgi:type I restriction enzyme R subunit